MSWKSKFIGCDEKIMCSLYIRKSSLFPVIKTGSPRHNLTIRRCSVHPFEWHSSNLVVFTFLATYSCQWTLTYSLHSPSGLRSEFTPRPGTALRISPFDRKQNCLRICDIFKFFALEYRSRVPYRRFWCLFALSLYSDAPRSFIYICFTGWDVGFSKVCSR